MRGKHRLASVFIRHFGITPACAGKTYTVALSYTSDKDHPRVCGENLIEKVAELLYQGSPPRVRGKRMCCIRQIHCSRITPACAGKTRTDFCTVSAGQDHPRVCGENKFLEEAVSAAKGSPPRVRGKPPVSCSCIMTTRITPACAGKTTQCTEGITVRKDHPRVCGENGTPPIREPALKGSPPRVRGKLRKSVLKRKIVGITPACAGKTTDVALRGWLSGDHPRVCGEN